MERGHQQNMNVMDLQLLNIVHIWFTFPRLRLSWPYTRSLSGPQLLTLIKSSLDLVLPAISVTVERGVKDVTDAATLCTNSKERDPRLE